MLQEKTAIIVTSLAQHQACTGEMQILAKVIDELTEQGYLITAVIEQQNNINEMIEVFSSRPTQCWA